MNRKEIEAFIDNYLMNKLNENNIFEKFMDISAIRNKLLSIVKDIIDTKKDKPGTPAGWHPFRMVLIRFPEYFDEDVDKEGAIVHELLHALSQKTINNNEVYSGVCYKINDIEKDKTVGYGAGLSEGITEYLAQRICKGIEEPWVMNDISFNCSGSYVLEQTMVKQLVELYAEDNIIDAYLNNKDTSKTNKAHRKLIMYFDQILEIHKSESKLDAELKELEEKNEKLDKKDEELEKRIKEYEIELEKVQRNMTEKFKEAQQYFLETFLIKEINKITTIEQAQEMFLKLKNLNSLNIKIDGNDKANYEMYNFIFIRRYLDIINKGKSINQQKKFDDIEKQLLGIDKAEENNNMMMEVESEEVEHLFRGKIKRFLNAINSFIMSKNMKKHVEFIRIERGTEGDLYIRACGEETIGGEKVINYQCLNAEEYEKYKSEVDYNGGEILKGNIELDKLAKDKAYEKAVSQHLLSERVLDDRLINYNGYIGQLNDNLLPEMNSAVENRMKEYERYCMINPKGYEEKIYIIEFNNNDNNNEKKDDLKEYMILTEDEVKKRKKLGAEFIAEKLIKGKIDLDRINSDKNYREFLENSFLTKQHINDRCSNYQGYVGEVKDCGYQICEYLVPSYLEEFSMKGANGEEKRTEEIILEDSKEKDKINWYIKKGEYIGEIDNFGNEIYEYEVIDSTEMIKMWENKSYIISPKREKILIKASEKDIVDLSYKDLENILMYNGGYAGCDEKLIDRYSKKTISLANGSIRLWEMGASVYLTSSDNEKTRVSGNLDIERMNDDHEYLNFILENVLSLENLDNIISGNINNIQIEEKDGGFSIGSIGKKDDKNCRNLAKTFFSDF